MVEVLKNTHLFNFSNNKIYYTTLGGFLYKFILYRGYVLIYVNSIC